VSEWRKDQVKYSDRLRPVLIPAGALGPQAPECDLYVSPQHRLLIQSSDAICDTSEEVFVSAKHLIGHNGIHQKTIVSNITTFGWASMRS